MGFLCFDLVFVCWLGFAWLLPHLHPLRFCRYLFATKDAALSPQRGCCSVSQDFPETNYTLLFLLCRLPKQRLLQSSEQIQCLNSTDSHHCRKPQKLCFVGFISKALEMSPTNHPKQTRHRHKIPFLSTKC